MVADLTEADRVPFLDCLGEFRHNGVVKIRPENDRHTRGEIVQLLLEAGPITAGEIGDRLGISAAGVRRHLDALLAAGEAQASPAAAWQQHGRGRPAKRYRLTAAGRAKLGHTYDDLAAAAMRQLREIGGDEAVRTFARRRIDAILSGVSEGPGDVESTSDRVAEALTKAGYATTTDRVNGPVDGHSDLSAPLPGVARRRGVPGTLRDGAGRLRGDPRHARAEAGDHRQR